MTQADASPREGGRIPEMPLHVIDHGEQRTTESHALFANKTVILFALPGAFTPTCSTEHLPRYEELAPRLRQHGIDTLICLSVNDPYVMNKWGREQSVNEVMLVADGNGDFSEAMGLLIDGRGKFMGRRSRRYSMLVRDGLIEKMFIEPEGAEDPYGVSSADTMLNYLAPESRPSSHVAVLSKPGCPYCARARKLLDEAGLRYVEIELADATRGRALQAIAGDAKAPQVFIDGRRIGGSDELAQYLASKTAA